MLFDFLRSIFSGGDHVAAHTLDMPMTVINPSTGLPMSGGGMGGVDVGGSLFGMDVHSGMADSFTSSMGSNLWE